VRPSEPPILGRHLVVVHNTDSGLVTGAVGAWKRLKSPDTFPCALCSLTRGVRGVNPTWQRHLDTLSEPVHTLSRDQFRAEHASSSWRNLNLPVILLQTGSKIEKLVSAAEIRKTSSVKELINKLDAALLAHPRDVPTPASQAQTLAKTRGSRQRRPSVEGR
jgi:hypothetical protein